MFIKMMSQLLGYVDNKAVCGKTLKPLLILFM